MVRALASTPVSPLPSDAGFGQTHLTRHHGREDAVPLGLLLGPFLSLAAGAVSLPRCNSESHGLVTLGVSVASVTGQPLGSPHTRGSDVAPRTGLR